MNALMTMAEMEDQFKSEWILIADPETDGSDEIVRGQVLFHSKDRDEVYRKAIELRPRDFAFTFTGRLPEGTAIVL
jgi:hypothetical protein